MKDNNSKQVLLSVLGVAILVVAVVGVSFAAFSYSKTGEKVNTITTGTITMSYSETTNGINLTNALPMTDGVGKALQDEDQYFDFTVNATIAGNTTINYAITAVKGDATVDDSAIKLYLTNMDNSADSEILAPTKISELDVTTGSENYQAPSGEFILSTGTLTSSASHSYRLRMWVADDFSTLTNSGMYSLRVNVYGAAAAQ